MLDDAEAAAEAAAVEVAAALTAAADSRGRAAFCLAGGSTPKRLYHRLAEPPWEEEVPWDRVELYWGDERCVPVSHAASNYRMVREALVDRLPVLPAAVRRIPAELGPAAGAAAYRRILRSALGDPPRFDLTLLGLGADGHTASLFPGAPDPDPGRLAVAARAPDEPHDRVSLTLAALNASRRVVFLVTGAAKAPAVAAVLGEERREAPGSGGVDLPARRVRPEEGAVIWVLDRAAAAALPAEAAAR